MLPPLGLVVAGLTILSGLVESTILQNGQVRETNFLNTAVDISAHTLKTYPPNATEISYQGRWDSKYVSWWSAPGLRFGFSGSQVAITFGRLTTPRVLVGYRIAGLDWQFTNVTGGQTHMFVGPETPGVDLTGPINREFFCPRDENGSLPSYVIAITFEMRVTNWAYGVQIEAVHVGEGQRLIKLPDAPRRIEVIVSNRISFSLARCPASRELWSGSRFSSSLKSFFFIFFFM